MFRSRTLTLFVLAVLLGSGAVWMANRWVLAQLKPAAGSDTAIVVAALEIPFGQKVEPAQVKACQLAENDPAAAILYRYKRRGGESGHPDHLPRGSHDREPPPGASGRKHAICPHHAHYARSHGAG